MRSTFAVGAFTEASTATEINGNQADGSLPLLARSIAVRALVRRADAPRP